LPAFTWFADQPEKLSGSIFVSDPALNALFSRSKQIRTPLALCHAEGIFVPDQGPIDAIERKALTLSSYTAVNAEENEMNTIRRIDPFVEFNRIAGLIDQMAEPTRSAAHMMPIDLLEHEGSFIIRAAVPGVPAEGLDVSLEGDVLTLKAEAPHGQPKGSKAFRTEIRSGALTRSIRIPEGYDLTQISAEMSEGLAVIRIPRLAPEEPHAIKVQVQPKA